MKRFKVRFHLARGDNYMHWQVTDELNDFKEYINPKKVSIVMYGCVLKNYPKRARKIYEGQNKTVCAWVECEHIDYVYDKAEVLDHDFARWAKRLTFNPRVHPHWQSEGEENLDNTEYTMLQTDNKMLFVSRE